MPLFDYAIWRMFLNPFEHFQDMLLYTQNITFSSYAESPSGAMPSRPWDWLIHLGSMEWLAYNSTKHEWYVQGYLMISPSIWVLIVPSMIYILYKALKRFYPAIFIISWFTGTYLVWIPISLITDRLSYVFYFYPTIGAISIGIALGLHQIHKFNTKSNVFQQLFRLIIPIYLLVSLVVFIAICPGNIWIQVSCSAILYAIARFYLSKNIG